MNQAIFDFFKLGSSDIFRKAHKNEHDSRKLSGNTIVKRAHTAKKIEISRSCKMGENQGQILQKSFKKQQNIIAQVT